MANFLSDLGKNVANKVVSGPVNAFSSYSSTLNSAIKGTPASISNTVLGSVDRAINDFFSSPEIRDWQHASKIFRSNSYSNAPKFKNIFYVYFSLNQNRLEKLNNAAFEMATNPNYGVLVKTADLPKFQLQLTEMNQYNRKRFVQSKVTYDPVSLTFHDDGGNLINRLWYAYFTYHYSDSAHSSTSNTDNTVNRRNVYDPVIEGDQMDWGMIGEPESKMGTYNANTQTSVLLSNQSKVPFFKYISIFSLNQKTFTEYRLVNPIIESFGHDSHDVSAASNVMEHKMSLRYEYVIYKSGVIGDTRYDVPMFARTGEYDETTSPIKTAGSSASILGDGGLIDSIPSFDQFVSDPFGSVQGLARSATQFRNPENVTGALTELATTELSSFTRNISFSLPF